MTAGRSPAAPPDRPGPGPRHGGALPGRIPRAKTRPMMHANDITYRIGERVLLDHASFAVPTGARVGLVGRNGTG